MIFVAAAAAHVPILSDGTSTEPNRAIVLEDVHVSRVFYHEIGDSGQQLWLTFEVTEPQSLKVDFAVPLIERLRDYRPALAILGPGLPDVNVPFEVPSGLGGVVLRASDVEPVIYDEVFSGTRAWRYYDTQVLLPAAGQYYVVAYHPTGESGKLWAALGTAEVFTPEDVATLREDIAAVRAFHEVGPDAAPPCFLFLVIPLAAAALSVRRRA